ncbi:unnamed protein product [Notodromas monacha]|uniref:Gustatory receptor n=1 Tax=Notodromas monacha TaxID=399045 RepID=A0A7R9BXZ6_9CRUS|nr:unnamed protein product [Notodromas monacha]CAG0922320.1 unnamed protein product [Notodromas monacha]
MDTVFRLFPSLAKNLASNWKTIVYRWHALSRAKSIANVLETSIAVQADFRAHGISASFSKKEILTIVFLVLPALSLWNSAFEFVSKPPLDAVMVVMETCPYLHPVPLSILMLRLLSFMTKGLESVFVQLESLTNVHHPDGERLKAVRRRAFASYRSVMLLCESFKNAFGFITAALFLEHFMGVLLLSFTVTSSFMNQSVNEDDPPLVVMTFGICLDITLMVLLCSAGQSIIDQDDKIRMCIRDMQQSPISPEIQFLKVPSLSGEFEVGANSLDRILLCKGASVTADDYFELKNSNVPNASRSIFGLLFTYLIIVVQFKMDEKRP